MDENLGITTVPGIQRATEIPLVTDGMQGVRGSSPLSSTHIAAGSGCKLHVRRLRAGWLPLAKAMMAATLSHHTLRCAGNSSSSCRRDVDSVATANPARTPER